MADNIKLAKLLLIGPNTYLECRIARCMKRLKQCTDCEFSKEVEHYPDFTKPNNFIKLLEIFWGAEVNINFSFLNPDSIFNIHSVPYKEYFITSAIKFMKEYTQQSIQEKAQNTDWVYERYKGRIDE